MHLRGAGTASRMFAEGIIKRSSSTCNDLKAKRLKQKRQWRHLRPNLASVQRQEAFRQRCRPPPTHIEKVPPGAPAVCLTEKLEGFSSVEKSPIGLENPQSSASKLGGKIGATETVTQPLEGVAQHLWDLTGYL